MAMAMIDAGPLVAYYNAGDPWHKKVLTSFERYRGQFVTTSPIITEVMWLLRSNYQVQNELLVDLSKGLYYVESLKYDDFARIADLNTKYSDLPGDFADLSLIAIAERLNLEDVISLDADFNLYRRYKTHKFNRILLH